MEDVDLSAPTPPATPAVLRESKFQLIIPDRQSLSAQTLTALEGAFIPLYEEAKDLARQAALVKVDRADQVGHMQEAKRLAKAAQALRKRATEAHKEHKEESLRRGRAIDSIKNAFLDVMGPVEDWLNEQADFVKNLEKKRIDALRAERTQNLARFAQFVPLPTTDIGALSDADWETLLAGTQARYNAALNEMEAQTAAQKERELAAQKEAARLKAENEALRIKNELRASRTRLLTSAEGMDLAVGDLADLSVDDFNRLHDDAKARKLKREDERAKERQAQADRDRELAAAKQREAEQQRKFDAEKRAQEEAKAKAAAAPDREKLLKLRADIIHFIRESFPEVTTPEAKAITGKLLKHFNDTSAWLGKQIDSLPS